MAAAGGFESSWDLLLFPDPKVNPLADAPLSVVSAAAANEKPAGAASGLADEGAVPVAGAAVAPPKEKPPGTALVLAEEVSFPAAGAVVVVLPKEKPPGAALDLAEFAVVGAEKDAPALGLSDNVGFPVAAGTAVELPNEKADGAALDLAVAEFAIPPPNENDEAEELAPPKANPPKVLASDFVVPIFAAVGLPLNEELENPSPAEPNPPGLSVVVVPKETFGTLLLLSCGSDGPADADDEEDGGALALPNENDDPTAPVLLPLPPKEKVLPVVPVVAVAEDDPLSLAVAPKPKFVEVGAEDDEAVLLVEPNVKPPVVVEAADAAPKLNDPPPPAPLVVVFAAVLLWPKENPALFAPVPKLNDGAGAFGNPPEPPPLLLPPLDPN